MNEDILFDDQQEEAPNTAWLQTLADMCMLLMTFFVLLISMADFDVAKFTESFKSVQNALSAHGMAKAPSPGAPKDITPETVLDQVKLRSQMLAQQKNVHSDLQSYISKLGVEGLISAKLDAGKVVINIPSEVLFAPGQAELSEEGKKAIGSLKDFFLKQSDQQINVRGFTNDLPPPPSSRFRDNWELSSMRAVSVLRELLGYGIPASKMTATGLADLEPLFPNTTEEMRAKNARVEFVLEKMIGG